MVGACTKNLDHLTERGFKQKIQLLDNEYSTALKNHQEWYCIPVFFQAHTNKIQQNNPYILTRTTSSLDFVECIPTSQYKYDIASSHMQKLHSIYYDNHGCNQNYQNTHISMDSTTTTLHLWPHMELELFPTKNRCTTLMGNICPTSMVPSNSNGTLPLPHILHW